MLKLEQLAVALCGLLMLGACTVYGPVPLSPTDMEGRTDTSKMQMQESNLARPAY